MLWLLLLRLLLLLLLLLLLGQAAELKAAGIDKVVAVTVAPPQEVAQWAAQHGFDKADMVRRQAPSAYC
jgi:hypothetical protein